MRYIKTLSAIIGSVLLLAGCSKAVPETTSEAAFTVTTTADATRAIADNDGNAASVNRFVMEIWRNVDGGTPELYDRQVKYNASGIHETTFYVSLVKSQEYDVLFWADCAANGGADLYYDTSSLKNVTFKGSYAGNDDARDAFSNATKVLKTDDAASIAARGNIILKRPFGQLNVITTDIDDILAASQGDKVVPDDVKLSFSVPAAFNVLSQEPVGSDVKLSYDATPYYKVSGKNADGKHTLSMDYIFVPASDGIVFSVFIDCYNRGTLLNNNLLENVPVKRNYRTNVYGDLLTLKDKFIVVIDEAWNTPDTDINN